MRGGFCRSRAIIGRPVRANALRAKVSKEVLPSPCAPKVVLMSNPDHRHPVGSNQVRLFSPPPSQTPPLPAAGRRRSLLAIAASLCAAFPAVLTSSCSSTNYGDEQFTLRLAAFGKDVMWMPSGRAISLAMLEAAKLEPHDVVYDLGSGDGIIPILAAQQFGVRAVGIEYNPDLVALSQRNALRAGVASRVSFRRGDIFTEDFSEASVVTLYLGEDLNQRLRPRLLALKPGTRVVSNRFSLGSWVPDAVIDKVPNEYAMLWVVPAQVGGLWRVSAPGLPLPERLEILQSNQMIEIRSGSGYFATALGEGRLQGLSIAFDLEDKGTGRLSVRGTVRSARIEAVAILRNQAGATLVQRAVSLERSN